MHEYQWKIRWNQESEERERKNVTIWMSIRYLDSSSNTLDSSSLSLWTRKMTGKHQGCLSYLVTIADSFFSHEIDIRWLQWPFLLASSTKYRKNDYISSLYLLVRNVTFRLKLCVHNHQQIPLLAHLSSNILLVFVPMCQFNRCGKRQDHRLEHPSE